MHSAPMAIITSILDHFTIDNNGIEKKNKINYMKIQYVDNKLMSLISWKTVSVNARHQLCIPSMISCYSLTSNSIQFCSVRWPIKFRSDIRLMMILVYVEIGSAFLVVRITICTYSLLRWKDLWRIIKSSSINFTMSPWIFKV